jgi:signal transduction histidine kinase
LATLLATGACVWVAIRRAEREILQRLSSVAGGLTPVNFPPTPAILERLSGLTGARFAAFDADGQTIASAIPNAEPLAGVARELSRITRSNAAPRARSLRHEGSNYLATALPLSQAEPFSTILVLYPETSLRQAQLEAAIPVLSLGALGLISMILVTTWVTQRMAAALRGIDHQLKRIGQGEFSAGVLPSRSSELDALARRVNALGEALRQMQETVRRTERARLLAQLAAGLAHQMRNAVAGARMAIQLHGTRCRGPEEDSSLSVALAQLSLTEEQMSSLLSLGRPEERALERFSIEELMREVGRLLGPAARHGGIELRIAAGPETATIVGDRSAIRAALLNLTQNAIEAAGRGGRVTLGADLCPEANLARLVVSDTGPGPSPSVGASLFQPFVTTKAEGTGLGLAFVERVASEHSGSISWERRAGETWFQLDLPCRVSPSEPAEAQRP